MRSFLKIIDKFILAYKRKNIFLFFYFFWKRL